MHTIKRRLFATMLMLVGVLALCGAPKPAEAAKWRKMSVSKYADKAYCSNAKKTSKIRLTVNSGGEKVKFVVSKSKMKKDVAKLNKAMKKGLKKNPKMTISYKKGNDKVTLKINKKKGSFTVKSGKRTIVKKSFTFKKWKKNTYLLQNKSKGTTFTLRFFGKTAKSFRLYNGKTTKASKQLARYGLSNHGKYVMAQSKLPFMYIVKAEYR